MRSRAHRGLGAVIVVAVGCGAASVEAPHPAPAATTGAAPATADAGPSAPPGTPRFACGDLACARGVEVCQITHPGMGAPRQIAQCVPLAERCRAAPSCACVGVNAFCRASPEGDLVVEVHMP